jgi:hypothetical protein
MNDWRRDERDTNYRERQVITIEPTIPANSNAMTFFIFYLLSVVRVISGCQQALV